MDCPNCRSPVFDANRSSDGELHPCDCWKAHLSSTRREELQELIVRKWEAKRAAAAERESFERREALRTQAEQVARGAFGNRRARNTRRCELARTLTH